MNGSSNVRIVFIYFYFVVSFSLPIIFFRITWCVLLHTFPNKQKKIGWVCWGQNRMYTCTHRGLPTCLEQTWRIYSSISFLFLLHANLFALAYSQTFLSPSVSIAVQRIYYAYCQAIITNTCTHQETRERKQRNHTAHMHNPFRARLLFKVSW